MVSVNLMNYIEELIIDKDNNHAMERAVFEKGKFTLKRSDHFTLILSLKNIPKSSRNIKPTKSTMFNLNKKEGWDNYKENTDEVIDKLENVINDANVDSNEMMETLEKVHTKIKFKSFG